MTPAGAGARNEECHGSAGAFRAAVGGMGAISGPPSRLSSAGGGNRHVRRTFMRIGIIGVGAIGGIVGGMLTKAGRDVTLIDQWPEHVEIMRTKGLRLSGT